MPICTSDGLDIKSELLAKFSDDEEVFYCETTKEIFRDYQKYFQRIMLINSTIWACEFTGRDNLTYAEARKSEKKARKLANSLKDALRAPVLLEVKRAQQSSPNILLNNIYHFIKDRYFRGEIIISSIKKSKPCECKIIDILAPDKVPENGIFLPSDIKYKIQKLDSTSPADTCFVSNSEIKRRRADFTHEILQFFIKENVELSPDGILRPKDDVYKKYVIEPQITFEYLFVGKLPDWKPSKPRKIVNEKGNDDKGKSRENGDMSKEKEKKQETLSKYLVKKNAEDFGKLNHENEVECALRERLQKLQKLKEEKQAEIEQKRLDQQKIVDKKWLEISTICDDLERADQKPLPPYNRVKSIFPIKYFGDFLHIKEFIQSHSQLIASNPFRDKISFYEMCRAFTVREVAGPLSDILQLLLNTIFLLQREEEEECRVEYIKNPSKRETRSELKDAAATHKFIEKHYSSEINELPVDALSVSEVLRLHLLGSGATTDERAERWRFNYRNGYDVTEDPGLEFKQKYPHIIRALKTYTFYQLPLSDIIKVLNCLISQILTYSGPLNLIEERYEAVTELRKKIRALHTAENKRVTFVSNEKRRLAAELSSRIAEIADEDGKKKIQEEINNKIKKINADDEREKEKFSSELLGLETDVFDYILYLGSDRAYRNYYIFESLPGIFVEHLQECYDVCLKNPPKNDYQIAYFPHNRKDMKVLLLKQVIQKDKENEKRKIKLNGEANKENYTIVNNGEISKVNGTTTMLPLNGEIKPALPSAYDLMMCTGDPSHCIVHDVNNPDRVRWSFIYSEEELEELVNTLNPFGIRESSLREQILHLKSLIIKHIKNCPVELLSFEESAQADFKNKIISETHRKYKNSNMGCSINTTINEIMYSVLVEEILDFECNITAGNLGRLKVKNLDQWRTDIRNNSYNSQCQKLAYGVEDQAFSDPGEHLGDTIDIDSEDSSDEDISLHNSPELLKTVTCLASALLQIEQAIEQRFFKEPFGVKYDRDLKKNDDRLELGRRRLKQWEMSLMASTSFSQVHLHKVVLSNAVKWSRSATQARCSVCNRKGDADKLLLCDNCNCGTHMYCLTPKLTTVPEGNWYCQNCEEKRSAVKKSQQQNKRRTRKRVFKMDDEDEDEMDDEKEYGREIYAEKEKGSSSSETDNEQTCFTCFDEGAEIQCKFCSSWFHFQCVHLKRAPRGRWMCNLCKMKDRKRRIVDSDKESVDSDDILSKRSKRLRTAIISDAESDESEPKRSRRTTARKNGGTTNQRRSARTAVDELPLNSAVLYELLDDIMKREDAWPFIRPVSQNELPDYYEIITKPMDFAKIKSNLNMARYKTNAEVMRDIELVFTNCDVYNTQGNDVYKAGATLEKFVIERCKQLNLPFRASDMSVEAADI